jgi:hypothetical protein
LKAGEQQLDYAVPPGGLTPLPLFARQLMQREEQGTASLAPASQIIFNVSKEKKMADWDDDQDRMRRRDFDRDFDRNYDRGYYYQGGRSSRMNDYGYDRDLGSNYGRNSYDYDRDFSTNYGRGSDYNDDTDRGYGRGGPASNRGNMMRRRGADYDTNYNRGLYDTGSQRANYGRGYSGRSNYSQDFYDEDFDSDFDFESESDTSPTYWTYTEYWLIPGPFTGMGPEGYQRADDRIEEDVCERLTQHGRLDASDIQVEVKNAEVTLKGEVDSRGAKRMAEDTAESVSGVKDVHNELKVRRGVKHEQGAMMGQERGQSQSEQQTQQTQPSKGSMERQI